MTDINDILRIRTNNLKPSKGKVLISEPFLIDYYFRRSVVLLAEHNEDGSFGLIINKPVEMFLHDVVKGFPQFDAPVFLGGPVKTDTLFFLHTKGNLIDNSMEIINGLFWGGDIEHVKEMIVLDQIKPTEIKFFAGYSGWVSKQLEGELSRNSWLVANTKVSDIMQPNTSKMWDKNVKRLGVEYAYWTNFPSDPSLN